MSDLKSAMAFCAELGRSAKTALVSADGIGAELAPMLLAMRDDEAIGRVVFHNRETFLAELGLAGALTRAGWGVDALLLMTESYGITNDDNQDDEDDEDDEDEDTMVNLARRFAAGDQSVVECLTILGISDNDECSFFMLPYKVGLGRTVKFSKTQKYDFIEDGDSARVLSDAMQVPAHSFRTQTGAATTEAKDAETLELLLAIGMHAKLI